ncbi:hypothetical protein SD81_040200 [Tolypothrix campylonemoides VB511288]|nr:hypothetical protein SD81_040200 [Tolypothrix campylonemoides VB511288]
MSAVTADFRSSAPARRAYERPLRPAAVYAMFVAWSLFAVFVYSRYSQLGDAESYQTGAYGADAQARTYLVTLIAMRVTSLVGATFAHVVFALFAATGVAYLVHQARLRGAHRWPLFALLLIPNFGVWATVVGREAMFIGLLGLFMGAIVGHVREGGAGKVLLAIACAAGMVFLRAPFGAGMALFLLVALAYAWGPRTRMSVGVQLLGLLSLAAFVGVLLWPQIDAYIATDVLPKARSYFTVNSATTRLWVDMDQTGELFGSLWWALPLSLLGPTPAEVMARPMMLPFFLSGLVVLGLLAHQIRVALVRMPRGTPRAVMLVGWLPALTLILVSYVPFGIYNPGSAIRYSATFLLFLVMPSMLLSGLGAHTPRVPTETR